MAVKPEVGRYLFEHTISAEARIEKQLQIVALVGFVFAIISVLLNTNSISTGDISVLGIPILLKSLASVRLVVTLMPAMAFLLMLFLVSELLSFGIMRDYYASVGVDEAILMNEAISSSSKYKARYFSADAFSTFIINLMIAVIVVSFIFVPISTFIYSLFMPIDTGGSS